jgi:hypothetical protein
MEITAVITKGTTQNGGASCTLFSNIDSSGLQKNAL